MTAFRDRLGGLGAAVLVIGWCLSAPLGMVYWGVKGWLLGVVLSVLVPWYGLLSVLWGILA